MTSLEPRPLPRHIHRLPVGGRRRGLPGVLPRLVLRTHEVGLLRLAVLARVTVLVILTAGIAF